MNDTEVPAAPAAPVVPAARERPLWRVVLALALPVYGWFMKQRGTIPVYREKNQREMLAIMEQGMRREVAMGHSLPRSI